MQKGHRIRSAVAFLRGTMQNARRVCSAHDQRKNYFYFVVQESLRTFLNHFFTEKMQRAEGSFYCSTALSQKAVRYLPLAVTTSPVKVRLERPAAEASVNHPLHGCIPAVGNSAQKSKKFFGE